MAIFGRDKSPLKAVDDYWEYRRIVGDDDGGTLFTPEQFEEYKMKMVPQRVKNRLYKQHKTDFEVVSSERPLVLPCQVRGCRCPAYQYIPMIGTNPVRCRCKHLPQDHSEAPDHLCKNCRSCSGFCSPYTCGCGQPSSAHKTLVETKLQREARGRPIGRDVPYAAMGGLTGFSSLLDGYLTLEASSLDQKRDDNHKNKCSESFSK
ncbi:protein FAM221A isoform X2 [Antennarius striatus]|uniref:protein FAM221A isoform X2 n=1 Tax=Antennarius striatus TaxID=241820 RepID=UPI0035B475F0